MDIFQSQGHLVVQNGCWASNHHIYIPAGGEKEIEEGALALPFKDNFLVVTIFLHATGKNWVTWSQFSFKGELGNVGFVQDGYIYPFKNQMTVIIKD